MSSQAPSSRDPLTDGAPASGGAVGEDWSRPLAEDHIELLGFLAEVEREVLIAIRGEARLMAARSLDAAADVTGAQPANDTAPDPGPDGCRIVPRINVGDLGLALARVSRSLRLTIALRTKLIDDLRRADNNAAFDAQMAAERAAAERPRLKLARQKAIGAVVGRIIKEACPKAENALGHGWLTGDANEKLNDEETYGDFLTRPASEIIAHICSDLGLTPDWLRLSRESWARAELASGAVGWPLSTLGKIFEPPPLPADATAPRRGARRGLALNLADPPDGGPAVTVLRAAPPS